MIVYYISFIGSRKLRPQRIRVEFAIRAGTRREARSIANREIARLQGYNYLGCD